MTYRIEEVISPQITPCTQHILYVHHGYPALNFVNDDAKTDSLPPGMPLLVWELFKLRDIKRIWTFQSGLHGPGLDIFHHGFRDWPRLERAIHELMARPDIHNLYVEPWWKNRKS